MDYLFGPISGKLDFAFFYLFRLCVYFQILFTVFANIYNRIFMGLIDIQDQMSFISTERAAVQVPDHGNEA